MSGNFSAPPYYSVSGTEDKAYTTSPSTLTGLSTGLTLTNTTSNESFDITQISFYSDPSIVAIIFNWPGASSTSNFIAVPPGTVVELSGPTSGSILTDIAFSNFNAGTWTSDQAVYGNFDPVLTVGGAAIIQDNSRRLLQPKGKWQIKGSRDRLPIQVDSEAGAYAPQTNAP